MAGKIATIVPKSHFNLIRHDDYFMALVHCCSDEDYFNFFRERADRGHHVILDNSTVELGKPYPFKEYLEIANLMGAREIVLPDIYPDKDATLEECRKALELMDIDNDPGLVMACPQGLTAREWIDCAIEMLDLPINVLGISCRYTEMFGSRMNAIAAVMPYLSKSRMRPVRIHLLGCYLPPAKEAAWALALDCVQGVDSSTPCVYTQAGLVMNGQESPPHHHIDFLRDSFDISLLLQNITEWRKQCSLWL